VLFESFEEVGIPFLFFETALKLFVIAILHMFQNSLGFIIKIIQKIEIGRK
jgi:hypothetical protein